MGVLVAVGALIWNTVITAPANFGELTRQNAEIRTTVLEMKSVVASMSTKLEDSQRASSDLSARVSTLENQANTNANNIERLQEQVADR